MTMKRLLTKAFIVFSFACMLFGGRVFYVFWFENAMQPQTDQFYNFKIVRQSLAIYKVHNRQYPTTKEGLKALIENPTGQSSWRGPYIEPQRLRDNWGKEFRYEKIEERYILESLGPDGKYGTKDDLTENLTLPSQ